MICNIFNNLKKIPQFQKRSPVVWESLTWNQIENLQREGMDMCILPVGATEQPQYEPPRLHGFTFS